MMNTMTCKELGGPCKLSHDGNLGRDSQKDDRARDTGASRYREGDGQVAPRRPQSLGPGKCKALARCSELTRPNAADSCIPSPSRKCSDRRLVLGADGETAKSLVSAARLQGVLGPAHRSDLAASATAAEELIGTVGFKPGHAHTRGHLHGLEHGSG